MSAGPDLLMPEFLAYSTLKVLTRKSVLSPIVLELEGGISSYINAMVAHFPKVEFLAGTEVREVRSKDGTFVCDANGGERVFDQIVVAGSSRESARMVQGVAEAKELHETLASFRHFDTGIALHTDTSFMPATKRDWGMVNVFLEDGDTWQTEWSGRNWDVPVFRTWLPRDGRMPKNLIHTQTFHHLVVTPGNHRLQKRIAELQGKAGVWAVGMYVTDVDNHDSVLQSAVQVARRLAPASPQLAALEAEMARRQGVAAAA